MPIIVMGSEDGILRAFRETDCLDKFLHSPDNSFASIDIGCPVLSLSSLEGSPVLLLVHMMAALDSSMFHAMLL